LRDANDFSRGAAEEFFRCGYRAPKNFRTSCVIAILTKSAMTPAALTTPTIARIPRTCHNPLPTQALINKINAAMNGNATNGKKVPRRGQGKGRQTAGGPARSGMLSNSARGKFRNGFQ